MLTNKHAYSTKDSFTHPHWSPADHDAPIKKQKIKAGALTFITEAQHTKRNHVAKLFKNQVLTLRVPGSNMQSKEAFSNAGMYCIICSTYLHPMSEGGAAFNLPQMVCFVVMLDIVDCQFSIFVFSHSSFQFVFCLVEVKITTWASLFTTKGVLELIRDLMLYLRLGEKTVFLLYMKRQLFARISLTCGVWGVKREGY